MKRTVSKLLSLKWMRVEGSFTSQPKEVEAINVDSNDEDVGSFKERMASPSNSFAF